MEGKNYGRKKEQNSLSMLKWLLLWFITLFLTMLLSYIGTHYDIPFFFFSTERTSLPLVFPAGFSISTFFFHKSFRLLSNRFLFIWSLLKMASILLTLFSFFFVMYFCLDLFFD